MLNTSSDVLLSTTLLKRGPAHWNLAILDDICQQVPSVKTYHRYSEKSPERKENYQNITSFHLKIWEKLWVIVSCQSPIVLGVKHQGARCFKNCAGKLHKTIPLWSPKMSSHVTITVKCLTETRGGGTRTVNIIRDLDLHGPSSFCLQRCQSQSGGTVL